MKHKELKSLTKKEREEKLGELQKELMKINGQRAVGTVPKSPGQVKQIRKNIARLLLLQTTTEVKSTKEGEKKA